MRTPKHKGSLDSKKESISCLTTEDNLRGSDKTPKICDVVSVIEDVGRSFVSGADLLEEFKQFGLETIEANESSIDNHKHKEEMKNFFGLGLEKRTSSFDTILDFSRMVKLKEEELSRKSSVKNSALALVKL